MNTNLIEKKDMVGILKIAAYICERYKEEYGEAIDEMKLHKLLYFTQRECMIQTGKPMTSAAFEAWKYGPVSSYIHNKFMKGKLGEPLSSDLGYFYQPIFDKVFELYAPKDAWSLSILSHGEISWQRARQGIPSDQNSSRKLSTSDIQEDAARIRLRRFLLKCE
ncbi:MULTISPECIES: Panacea domain-containing protein [Parabacteroides]|nr:MULTISPECIES: Panacea domain-containing protein [Parabacteroides]